MRALFIPFLLLGPAVCFAADPPPPDWALQAAAIAPPSFPARVSSVTVLHEETVTVDPDGRRVMRERGAIRILQPGNERLEAYRTYNTKNGRIRDFQGWLIPPSGKPIPYGKNRIIDAALSQRYTYDEARAQILECGTAPPGSVFAWEVTEEEKTLFTQYPYAFQEQSPVLTSRFVLNLPPGWEVKATVFNRNKFDPQVSGNSYTWELRDLPWIEREAHSPSLAALAPRLAVSYFPPADNRAGLQGLRDWAAVSSWLSTLVDAPAQVTETIRAKAAELTADAPGQIDKIKAIAKFVQQTNYVEVALNITRGGGYTPHPANETLTRNYGDCKDKATLMRSLLKAAGIDSWLTVITSNDRTYVRPEWASPMQFNHAIVALRVSDAVQLPTVIENPSLGRLLIFDPTDPITPVGDLPRSEQGSHALVIAGSQGALLTMPSLPPAANRIESSVRGMLGPDGHLDAEIQRTYFGQAAVPLRGVEVLQGAEELKKRFEQEFGRRVAGTTVSGFKTGPQPAENGIAVTLQLGVQRFGQNMQGRLFIVRPGLLTSGGDYLFTSKQRTAPVKLEADMRRDTIRIGIPEGFKLDELPEPAKIESPYGTLNARWAVKDGEVVMEQTLEIRTVIVPAAEYPAVREFFERLGGAESAPVLLVRQ